MPHDLKPVGVFPTPWGVEVPVYPPLPGQDQEGYSFDMAATAICFGIHDREKRLQFEFRVRDAAQARRTIDVMKLADELGGTKPPKVPLSRPRHSCYQDVPTDNPGDGPSCREVVDAWVTALTDEPTWSRRAGALLPLLDRQMTMLGQAPDFVIGFPMTLMLTSVLENLGETQLDCLEAAAFYLLSAHEAWQDAGRSWLEPCRGTWFADWVAERPAYRRFALLHRAVWERTPAWAIEVTR